MACNCLTVMDAKLVEKNARVQVSMNMRTGTALPYIPCEKIDKKKRTTPVFLVPTFCPMCGTRYEPEPGT